MAGESDAGHNRRSLERENVNNKKLTTVVAAAAAAFVAMIAPAASATAQTTGSAVKASASAEKGSMSVHRRSFKCGSNRLNVSWGDGNASTTIYFNNHCGTKKAIQTWRVDGSGYKMKGACLTVNPHTHGKKRIWDPGFTVYNVTSPKHC